MRCPTELELARAVGTDTLAEHFAACIACRDERDAFERAIEIARGVSSKLPPPSRREEVRTAVLSATLANRAMARLAPPTRSRRVLSLGVAIAAVAAAAAAFTLVASSEPAPAPHVHATITAYAGARYRAVSTAPDEVIRLEHGTLDVTVAPLHAGERFRVIVGDAEVEVRGTAFEVVAADDRLMSVAVRHGRVEVRPRGGAHALLDAGGSWRARALPRTQLAPAPIVAPPPPAPPPPRARPAARARVALPSPPAEPPPAPPSRTRAPEEIAYDEAWSAMRVRDHAGAAAAFARVLLVAPDGSLAEDAAFWQAVALAHAGRRAQAITAFRDFLDAHPRSPHAGEASAMLGWLLLDGGQRAEAARRFRAAVGDANRAVRASARSGLAALGE